MIVELLSGIVHTMNSFGNKNDIDINISPGMIVEGRPKYKLHKKMIRFGAYALVHMGTENNLNARSVPTISLRQSNTGGGHYFMNVETGKRIHAHVWTELQLTKSVIAEVENIARKEKQPTIKNGNLIFEWSIGNEMEDDFSEDDNQSIDESAIIIADDDDTSTDESEHDVVQDNDDDTDCEIINGYSTDDTSHSKIKERSVEDTNDSSKIDESDSENDSENHSTASTNQNEETESGNKTENTPE